MIGLMCLFLFLIGMYFIVVLTYGITVFLWFFFKGLYEEREKIDFE